MNGVCEWDDLIQPTTDLEDQDEQDKVEEQDVKDDKDEQDPTPVQESDPAESKELVCEKDFVLIDGICYPVIVPDCPSG